MAKKIVSREECELIIKKVIGSATFEIVNFNTKPFEDKERHYYKPDRILEVSVKVTKDISRYRFFLKKYLTKYSALNELLLSANTSEREIAFYELFLTSLSKILREYKTDFAPHYYMSRANDIIIMEDMSLKMYNVSKKVNPHILDRFHICLALQAVAKLHAGSLAYEEIKLQGLKGSRLFKEEDLLAEEPLWKNKEEYLGYKLIQSGIKGIKTLLAQFQQLDKLDDSLCQKIDALVEKCFLLLKPQSKYRNVLCHGDLHTKNLLFKYETASPVDCVLLNFGCSRYFLPAYDVLSLIFFTSSQLFRQHYFTYLIQYYYNCFKQELSKQGLDANQILSFEELKESINYLMPLVKLKNVLHLQEHGAKEGFYKRIQKDDDAYRQFLFEDQSEFLLRVTKEDPIFKVMIIEALEELLDALNDSRVSREVCYEILEERLDTTVYDLSEFYLNPISDNDNNYELIMKVCIDPKEGTEKEYKYLVQCGDNNSITVISEIQ